jgi:hypothetical protein
VTANILDIIKLPGASLSSKVGWGRDSSDSVAGCDRHWAQAQLCLGCWVLVSTQ